MKITAILFFEANAEDLVVKLATCTSLTDDRTKARDEQHLDVSHLSMSSPIPMMNPASATQAG
jgi:hypothetical protein